MRLFREPFVVVFSVPVGLLRSGGVTCTSPVQKYTTTSESMMLCSFAFVNMVTRAECFAPNDERICKKDSRASRLTLTRSRGFRLRDDYYRDAVARKTSGHVRGTKKLERNGKVRVCLVRFMDGRATGDAIQHRVAPITSITVPSR